MYAPASQLVDLFFEIEKFEINNCDKPHRSSRTRSIPQSLIGEIVSTSKGFNPPLPPYSNASLHNLRQQFINPKC